MSLLPFYNLFSVHCPASCSGRKTRRAVSELPAPARPLNKHMHRWTAAVLAPVATSRRRGKDKYFSAFGDASSSAAGEFTLTTLASSGSGFFMRLKREREFVSRAGTPSRQTAVPLWWRIWTEWRVRRRSPPLCCWAAYMAVLQPRWCRIQLGKWTQPYRTGSLQWENTRIEKHQHQWFCCRTNRSVIPE